MSPQSKSSSSGITIDRLGHLGDGVTSEGVFVARALPGERVAGTVEKGRLARPRILEPSSQRVKAPCRHFEACGGCQLQHASDRFVADWKQDLVKQSLFRIGLGAGFRPIVSSPPHSRRRATFAGRRTKKGAVVGFHGRRSGTMVDLGDCPVLDPRVFAIVPLLRAMVVLPSQGRQTRCV